MNESELQGRVNSLLMRRRNDIPYDVWLSLWGTAQAGEPEVVFEAIWNWIIELDIEIDRQYLDEMGMIAEQIGFAAEKLDRLSDHVSDKANPG
jgi:hypothetical protein